MPLPPSSILLDHTYTRSSGRRGVLTRRILILGTQIETTSPLCIRPSAHTEDWVRYETWIGGKRMERSCTRQAFARWAEGEVAADQTPQQTKRIA